MASFAAGQAAFTMTVLIILNLIAPMGWRATRGSSEETDVQVGALSYDALVAGRTVEDAVRQYLSETGREADPRDPVVRAASHAVRLRSAVDTIADVKINTARQCYFAPTRQLQTWAPLVANRCRGFRLGGPKMAASSDDTGLP